MIKVLIVDDEYIMRQGLKYMIDWEHEGYQIVGEASNGKEALDLAEELKPHIIICDIVMPLLDGVDFAEIIHKMYPQIQTIILSGYDNFEYVKQTLMSGVSDYILKPALNQETLRKVLRKTAERIPGYTFHEDTGRVSYERMIERYLLGHDQELNTAELGKYFTNKYYHIYAVNIKKESNQGKDLSNIIYKKIERELLNVKDMQKLMVTLREVVVCVIFCHEFNQNQRVIKAAEELSDKEVIHAKEGTNVLSEYEEDYCAGMPVVTEHQYGKGMSYYIASETDIYFLRMFYQDIFKRMNLINPLGICLPYGVTVTERKGKDRLVFIMNFNANPVMLEGIGEWVDTDTGITYENKLEMEGFSCKVVIPARC